MDTHTPQVCLPSVESDRNEVRHTDPHCTLLLLLLLPVFFSFLFSQWQEEVGVVRLKNRDGDRRWLALTSRDKAIKGRGSRCCVYSNIRELAGKQGDYEKAQQLHSATWSLSRTEELRCSQPGSRKGLALLRPTAARFQPCSASVQPHRQLKISFRIIS